MASTPAKRPRYCPDGAAQLREKRICLGRPEDASEIFGSPLADMLCSIAEATGSHYSEICQTVLSHLGGFMGSQIKLMSPGEVRSTQRPEIGEQSARRAGRATPQPC